MPIMLGSSHCYLRGKNTNELALMKECPYDPKGYFIIKGTEKVVLMQEQMSKNRILVEVDNKTGSMVANCASNTLETKSRISLLIKGGKVYLKSNSFTELIPAIIVFKAMGLIRDQEIVQLIGTEKKILEDIFLSFQEAVKHRIHTQDDALKYLGERIRNPFKEDRPVQKSAVEDARGVLANIFLAHIKCRRYDFYPKCIYFGLMFRRLLLVQGSPELCDDKDYIGNKRTEAAGQMLALLFEDLFKKFNSELKREIDMNIKKSTSKYVDYDVTRMMNTSSITHGLVNSLSSGNWTIKRFKVEKKGVTQVLNRLSYISAIGMMTRMESHIEKSRKVSGPRALQPSHWGMLCPSDTPDGENCGLVKALALLAHISTETPDIPVLNLLISLGVQEISQFSGLEIHGGKLNVVFLNGIIVGVHSNYKMLIERFREFRRKGRIGAFVSINFDKVNKFINVSCDYGRLCRPYILVRNGKPLLTPEHIRKVETQEWSFETLVLKGIVEYLDVNEEDNSYIALYDNEVTEATTHLEIALYSLLGLVAGVIPYPHHNQSPRNTYQCAMGKQAIGEIGLNQLWRTDTVLYLLVYPQRPLVKTKTIELMNYENLPAGNNASVAVMSYSGYDIEDAVVINQASLDRGFGRIIYRRRYTTELEMRTDNCMDRLMEPTVVEDTRKGYRRKVIKRHRPLDKSGIARIGETVSNGDVYVNKEIPNVSSRIGNEKAEQLKYYPAPSVYHNPNPSRVEKVLLSHNGEVHMTIKTILSQVRRPELGDKFSSRHGQKGVFGLMVPEIDMPFSETGWRPDLIMNPHGFPSRMTVGKLIELIGAKSAALDGKFKYGTAFGGDKVDDLCKILVQNGFSYTGKDCLISGITGEYLNCYVFSGPIFYQRLKHLVADKIHARAFGKKTLLTRQPLEGRAKEGGLRLGEMERDCLVAYGTSALLLVIHILLKERLLYSSDVYSCGVCEKCGMIVSHKEPNYCPYCKEYSVSNVTMPYPCKLLFQEMIAMNIYPKIGLS